MTSHTIKIDATYEGPAESALEGSLHIEFYHHRADPDVGEPEGIVIENVRLQIGAAWHDFDGDLTSDALVLPCWQHLKDLDEAAQSELADRKRDEVRERVAEFWAD